MKIKIKGPRKVEKKPDWSLLEEFVGSGSVDDGAVKELEGRAKKRLLEMSAEFIKSEEAPVKTIRMLCDEIKQQAQKCLLALQAEPRPSYKSYIEYFTRVEITGGIPRHETATCILEYCLINPKLPQEVLTFANTYADYIYQAALESTLQSAKDYVGIIKLLSEKIPLDPIKNSTFIRVFCELREGLMIVARAPSVDFYLKAIACVLLTVGMESPQQPEALGSLLTLLVKEEGIEKTVWYQTIVTLFVGLERLTAQLKILSAYPMYKIRQEIIQDIKEVPAHTSNFMN